VRRTARRANPMLRQTACRRRRMCFRTSHFSSSIVGTIRPALRWKVRTSQCDDMSCAYLAASLKYEIYPFDVSGRLSHLDDAVPDG
jgi:hypothetical protein